MREVIARVARNAVPRSVWVEVTPLPFDGAALTLTCADRLEAAEEVLWQAAHHAERQLRRVGWHVTRLAARPPRWRGVGPGNCAASGPAQELVVLGWSLEALATRAALLEVSLRGVLGTSPDFTVGKSAELSLTHLRAALLTETGVREPSMPDVPSKWDVSEPSESDALRPGAVVRGVQDELSARYLRWPARLRELEGLQRCSTVRALRYALARVAGLERAVQERCEAHLALAARTVHLVLRNWGELHDLEQAAELACGTLRRALAGKEPGEWGRDELEARGVSEDREDPVGQMTSRDRDDPRDREDPGGAQVSRTVDPLFGGMYRLVAATVPNLPQPAED
ncbi:hypothetical protein ACIBG7_25115 [Nonomuraea sp. NPDC050328]|uniref:hypothetical protein n=1 Tax=Nonomuraea sp. NPDC050328 TaxID=3364361 RepID=UPI0037AEC9FC